MSEAPGTRDMRRDLERALRKLRWWGVAEGVCWTLGILAWTLTLGLGLLR